MVHSPVFLRNNERYRRFRRKKNATKWLQEINSMPGSVALNSFLYDSSSTSISQNFPLFALVFKQFAENVRPVVARNAGLIGILKNLKEPEQMLAYKIDWINEHGESMTNKAWRCHYSSVLGPCRGGLRLHPTVTPDMIQCLAFEHTLQNALLNMPMGGNMTGSDFDARNASDYDVLAFSRALAVKIRTDMDPKWPVDISADLGCGLRECTFMATAFRELINAETNRPFPLVVGRPHATGLGAVEFAKRLLRLPSFDKTTSILSGSGDCALSVAFHLIAEGGKVLSLSDSSGFLYLPDGLTFVQWQRIVDHKRNRTPLKDIVAEDGWLKGMRWHSGSVWSHGLKADYVFPCSCELEIDLAEAEIIVNQTKPKALIEVSHVACTPAAAEYIDLHKLRSAPAKVANSGAMVALGLNLSETTGKAEFEHRLKTFIHFVHDQCRAIYDQHYPNITFAEAVDICSLTRLGVAMREARLI